MRKRRVKKLAKDTILKLVSWLFIAAPFKIARTWKQPRCSLIDEWIKKLWYICTMEYYSVIKRKRIWVSSNEVDESRAYYTEWSKSEKERYNILTHIYGIRKNVTENYLQGSNGEKDIGIDLWTWGEGRRGWDVWKK